MIRKLGGAGKHPAAPDRREDEDRVRRHVDGIWRPGGRLPDAGQPVVDDHLVAGTYERCQFEVIGGNEVAGTPACAVKDPGAALGLQGIERAFVP